jgi:hypothetical protein
MTHFSNLQQTEIHQKETAADVVLCPEFRDMSRAHDLDPMHRTEKVRNEMPPASRDIVLICRHVSRIGDIKDSPHSMGVARILPDLNPKIRHALQDEPDSKRRTASNR